VERDLLLKFLLQMVHIFSISIMAFLSNLKSGIGQYLIGSEEFLNRPYGLALIN